MLAKSLRSYSYLSILEMFSNSSAKWSKRFPALWDWRVLIFHFLPSSVHQSFRHFILLTTCLPTDSNAIGGFVEEWWKSTKLVWFHVVSLPFKSLNQLPGSLCIRGLTFQGHALSQEGKADVLLISRPGN